MNDSAFILWQKKCQKNLNRLSSMKEAKDLMKKNNPIIIPRNHLVEEALEEAGNGNINSFPNKTSESTTTNDKSLFISEF